MAESDPTPSLIQPEDARFLTTPQPVLLVALPDDGPPLPPLTTDEAGAPAALEGWSVLARMTFCVVDGPENQGFLIPTLADGLDFEAVTAWTTAVADCGGAYVFQLPADQLDAPLAQVVKGAETRGGYVASAG